MAALTKIQVENAVRDAIKTILSITSQNTVRMGWPADESPGFNRTDDVIFVLLTQDNSDYSRLQETVYGKSASATEVDSSYGYTRTHSVQLSIYGPSSYENADKISRGIFTQAVTEAWYKLNLFPMTMPDAPRRVPELFNKSWWERCDFTFQLNEKVIVTSKVPYLVGTNIQVKYDQ